MNSYRVWFTETKKRTGFIDVYADSEDDAKDKVGNNYRYSPSMVTNKARRNKSLTTFTEVLYPTDAKEQS